MKFQAVKLSTVLILVTIPHVALASSFDYNVVSPTDQACSLPYMRSLTMCAYRSELQSGVSKPVYLQMVDMVIDAAELGTSVGLTSAELTLKAAGMMIKYSNIPDKKAILNTLANWIPGEQA